MMRLLTVRQPWASLIVRGTKRVENRSWRTDYRGDIAIIASARNTDTGARATEAFLKHIMGDEEMMTLEARYQISTLPRGGVLGVVTLHGIYPENPDEFVGQSWWFTGPHGFILHNARQTSRVVKVKGSMTLARCSDELEAEIRGALTEGE